VPIYEYRCPNGHTFEVFQRMSDPPVESCQVCGTAPVEKLLFPVAVHFKGKGFYSTDYGRGSRGAGKDGDGGGTAKESSSGDSGSSSSEKKSSSADSGGSSSGSGSSSSGSSSSSSKND
jgi:putative FmdB family regulatory protein